MTTERTKEKIKERDPRRRKRPKLYRLTMFSIEGTGEEKTSYLKLLEAYLHSKSHYSYTCRQMLKKRFLHGLPLESITYREKQYFEIALQEASSSLPLETHYEFTSE